MKEYTFELDRRIRS